MKRSVHVGASFTCSQKDAADTGVAGEFDIFRGIAYDPGVREIDIEIGLRGSQHSRLGFAAVAGRSPVGMMRAEVDGVEMGSVLLQGGAEFVVDAAERELVAISARDDGLVSEQDGQKTGFVDFAHGRAGSFNEDQLVRFRDYRNFDIQGSVPIEENGSAGTFLWGRASALPPSFRSACRGLKYRSFHEKSQAFCSRGRRAKKEVTLGGSAGLTLKV
jgi:hypothetical protein